MLFIIGLQIVGSEDFDRNREGLSGFSNPSVVTVWAVFILSGGLTRTGVADISGRFVLRLTGSDETEIIMGVVLFFRLKWDGCRSILRQSSVRP
jgi:di/tricarboxylate transporter